MKGCRARRPGLYPGRRQPQINHILARFVRCSPLAAPVFFRKISKIESSVEPGVRLLLLHRLEILRF